MRLNCGSVNETADFSGSENIIHMPHGRRPYTIVAAKALAQGIVYIMYR